jgi:prepilin-type N-terminal cleavage/methylation domain-containing protein
MIKNEKGFSVVEILIVIVVVGLIGAVAWLIYDRQGNNKKTDTYSDTIQNQQVSPTPEVQEESEYSLSTKLTSLNKKFTISVPDGWIYTNDTEQDYAYATGMNYQKGTDAIINNEYGHRGGGFNTTSFVIQYSKDELKDYFSASSADGVLILNNGKKAKKFTSVINNDELGIPDGSKTYGYQIDYEGGTIVFSYLVTPNDEDNVAIVEASIKTLSY